MKVAVIAAVARNGVIGRAGRLPWRLPADLRRFRRLTWGRPVIMGRRTFLAIGRPLPGRRNIVLSRNPAFRPAGVEVAGSFADALALAGAAPEVFVIGGEEVYREALARADRLYLTCVDAEVEGDVRFPAVDLRRWRLVEEEAHPADGEHPYPFVFRVYERLRVASDRETPGGGRRTPDPR